VRLLSSNVYRTLTVENSLVECDDGPGSQKTNPASDVLVAAALAEHCVSSLCRELEVEVWPARMVLTKYTLINYSNPSNRKKAVKSRRVEERRFKKVISRSSRSCAGW